MYRKRKKRKRGKGLLLGSDWPKINRNLQLYLRKKKQKGGSLYTWLLDEIKNLKNYKKAVLGGVIKNCLV